MTKAETPQADFAPELDWITGHPWFAAIGAPLPGKPPQGEDIDDLEAFHEIESELMKRGTLAHGQIRWTWVGQECAALTRTKARDFRLIEAMLWSLPHSFDVPHLPLAASLTARFLGLWSKTARPAGRAKKMHLSRIADVLETMTSKAAGTLEPAEVKAVAAAISHSLPFVEAIAPDAAARFSVLPERLEKTNEPEAAAPREQTTAAAAGGAAHASAPEAKLFDLPAPRPEALRLDLGNERALKQSLSMVADFLLALDVKNPLSYQLRRFATWHGIAALPPLKSDNRTVLAPVSEDVASTYRQAAERGTGGAEIVQKLERSCHLQPFWLEGQMIAAKLAKACGREAASEAIRAEAQQFASSLPGLDGLCFSDGSPLINDETRAFLTAPVPVAEPAIASEPTSSVKGNQAGVANGGLVIDALMLETVQTAREKAEAGDLGAALLLLDETQTSQTTPRTRAIAELLTLECLKDWGLATHAAIHAARLEQELAPKTAQEWEPEFFERLQGMR